MGRTLYVSNLDYGVTSRALEQLFRPYGPVTSAQVVLDRETGRSRGFGFVEMATDREARAAVTGLSGKSIDGRVLTVREAQPREGPGEGRRKGPGGRRAPAARKRPPALGRRLRKARPEDGKTRP